MKALTKRSAMLFMSVIYTMALLMKCMLSFNNFQPNMKTTRTRQHQEIPYEAKSKFIGWFCFSLHQLTVTRTHDDPCSALLGYLTKNDCRHLKHYNTHQNKQSPWFNIIPRFQNYSKDMKSMERHIQLIINVPHVICLSVCLSVLLIHMRRNVWE